MDSGGYLRLLLSNRIRELDKIRQLVLAADEKSDGEKHLRTMAALYAQEIRGVVHAFATVEVIDRAAARHWLDETRREFNARGLGEIFIVAHPNGPPVDI